MSLGTLVYDDGATIIPIEAISMRDGEIIFYGPPTMGPHTWKIGGALRVHGTDGRVVFAVVIPPLIRTVDAGETGHVEQRLRISEVSPASDSQRATG